MLICSWVAKLLVERGYTVRGTVRSTTNPRSLLLAEDFKSIPGDGKLVLFEADILQESSLTDALFQDAEYVFHVASPFYLKGRSSQEIRMSMFMTAMRCQAPCMHAITSFSSVKVGRAYTMSVSLRITNLVYSMSLLDFAIASSILFAILPAVTDQR